MNRKKIFPLVLTIIFLISGCNTHEERNNRVQNSNLRKKNTGSTGEVDLKDDMGRTRLHYAVIRDKPDIVRQLIEDGAEVNIQDNNGFSPLHYAGQRNYLSSVTVLLNNHADPDLKDHYNCTPLHHAAEKGNDKIVNRLLEAGADTEITDNNGDNPLKLAEENKHYQVMRYLLPLYNAIENGDLEKVKTLLVENPKLITQRDPFSRTPLHWAYRFDQDKIMEFLLENGLDRNLRDKFNYSAENYSLKNRLRTTGISILSKKEIDRLDWLVYAWLKKYRYLNVGYVIDGEIVLTKSFGSGNINGVHSYGSVSKPLTAMIILKLHLEKSIESLDDNIWKYSKRYLNSMPDKYKDSQLTIRHLLEHKSGIPHNRELTWKNNKLNLKFRPGSEDLYSTPGYGILGHIIEDVTSLSFSSAVKKYIGDPVGGSSLQAQNVFKAPGARISSNITDMARFAAGMINNQYFSEDAFYRRVLHSPSGSFSWQVSNSENKDVSIWHGGSNGLPQAYLEIKPGKKLAIAILAETRNRNSWELDQLGKLLIQELEDIGRKENK